MLIIVLGSTGTLYPKLYRGCCLPRAYVEHFVASLQPAKLGLGYVAAQLAGGVLGAFAALKSLPGRPTIEAPSTCIQVKDKAVPSSKNVAC